MRHHRRDPSLRPRPMGDLMHVADRPVSLPRRRSRTPRWRRRIMTILRTGGWLLLVCLPAPAAAQDPGDFGQLLGVIEPGDDIRVILSSGRRTEASVVRVTPGTLSVRVGDQQLDLDRGDVWAVRYRIRDPTSDGFRRGFAGGVASLALLAFSYCPYEGCGGRESFGSFILAGGLFGMVGGWIGAGVDHLIQKEAGWPTTTRRTWSVAPVLVPDRQGVAVSLSF